VRSRPFFTVVLAAASVFLCTGCDEHSYLNVWIVSGPDHVVPGDTATFVITSRATNWSPTFRYVMYWGDESTRTVKSHVAGDTERMTHVWQYPGTYEVWATALLPQGDYGSVNSSAHKTVIVSSVSDPVIDSAQFNYLWRPIELVAFAHDPAGESLRLAVAWGDGQGETTGFQASPCRLSASHRYANPGDVKVVFRVFNKGGVASAPDTLSGTVSTYGEVSSFYLGSYSGSPVIASNGSEEIVYLVGPDGFQGLRPGGAWYTYPGVFVGHPSFSSQTAHIYIGSDEGWLYAFTPTLGLAWRYPDSTGESLPGAAWGAAAVKGNALYVPCANESIYCLVDNGASVSRGAVFGAQASLVDAPAVDAGGSVYFSTDSGYLYKLTGGLNLIWSARLQAGGVVHGPVLDADGTVYCSSDSNRLYAVNPADGSVKWTATLDGAGPRPAVGSDGVYVGTLTGRFYRLDKTTGAVAWEKQFEAAEFASCPILTTSGSVCAVTSSDVLYSLDRLYGSTNWVCNCPKYLPRQGRFRPLHLTDYHPSPTVNAAGQVYVVGTDALYKLATYGQLDASSPWPKWQHDRYNTGYVSGGK
jgi:outer membrane protein assembly factor BamB